VAWPGNTRNLRIAGSCGVCWAPTAGKCDSWPIVDALPSFGLISPQEAAKALEMLQSDPDFVLLDIRTPAEVEAGHLPGAIMLDDYGDAFREELSRLDRDAPYLIYCRTGNRTGNADRMMEELGFTRVYDLNGGISQWIAQGLPLCEGSLESDHTCAIRSAIQRGWQVALQTDQ